MQTEPPKADSPKRKRRWFQFSLRSLLIFTIVVAVACGWLGKRIEQKRKEHEVVETIRKLGGAVYYDYDGRDFLSPRPDSPQNTEPFGPAWLRSLLGDSFFSEVTSVSFAHDNLTDDELGDIELLPQLKSLRLRDSQITDAGLKHLEALSQLQTLVLDTRGITDVGLEHLKRLAKLQRLILPMTPQITDAGLVHLKDLTRLELLNVRGTAITVEAAAKFKKLLPECEIEY
jgi:hypothetical protein